MKLFLISRKDDYGYDDFDSAVVCAENEETARNTNPNGSGPVEWGQKWTSWANHPDLVVVTYLGEADPNVAAGVVCSSFNAG